jgi:hypothetical protein
VANRVFQGRCRSQGFAFRVLGTAGGMIVLSALIGPAGAGSPIGMTPCTEEAVARGIVYFTPFSETSGRGMAFVDLDDDGDADLVALGRVDGVIGVWENDGTGNFTDRSATSNIPIITKACGVSAADYDRDGDLDLYISAYTDVNFLLRNDGGFVFTDVAARAGVRDPSSSFGTGWADYDNDGWIDLYVANRPTENRLYRNLGDGTFVDVAVALGVDRGNDPSFQGTFFDYDRDGDPDLYIANDKGYSCETTDWRNRIFENTGGAFTDVTGDLDAGACIAAMCIALGDIDGNGYQDIYCTNLPFGNVLQLNYGAGTPFVDVADQYGVVAHELGWGSAFLDLDNDTQLDLYVCQANTGNHLYHNQNGDACQEIGAVMNVASPLRSFCVATADIDLDGDVDLITQDEASLLKLYINHEGSQHDWIRFDVVGQGVDRFAIGAMIDVTLGEKTLIREVIAGNNYKSQNELVQSIGLGDGVETIDRVDVMWPGGTMRSIAGLPAGATWRLLPPDKLGDSNGDGDIDIDDLIAVINAFNPAPSSLKPGQEALDLNGNSSIDLDDLLEIIRLLTMPTG